MGELKVIPPAELTCRVSAAQARMHWLPAQELAWTEAFRDMVAVRMEVLGAHGPRRPGSCS
ncbi:hypothetical protein IV102_25545 [bacterium]|nr:hypothetical protein [bacterium]